MGPNLQEIEAWARAAGAMLREGYGKPLSIDHKGRIDLVTEMDHRVEAFLLGSVRERYPAHTILSEESGYLTGLDEHVWFIDPLDGTTNYAHAIPIFSVSIAYAEHGQVQMGVVYEPMRDECFTAVRGQGAFRNGERIHVSENRELVTSLMVTGFPYDSSVTGSTNLENFAHFTRLTQGVRRMGSAAVDLCYIACGRFDGYWETILQPWDLAAGTLIVQEAGGVVTSLQGDPNFMQRPYAILVGNPRVHALMLQEFQEKM